MRSYFVGAVAVVLAACSGGKGSGENPADASAPDADEAGIIGCQNDAKAETYTANLAKAGTIKALTFTLVESVPAPPAKGSNTWTVKVTDASGAPVKDAKVTVDPQMPEHGHGSSVVAKVTAVGDGTYTIEPLYLFMAGLWRVTITAVAGATTDTASFTFCIVG
jgi:nitrogen fixation protein FixH